MRKILNRIKFYQQSDPPRSIAIDLSKSSTLVAYVDGTACLFQKLYNKICTFAVGNLLDIQ
ncbi:unnamed protein product, partial [Larinioides sclopetarius]